MFGMKSIYVTSVERYSGKTAVCLALGKHFQKDGHEVGYFKPLSIQPWLEGGKIVDEDALFVKEVLNLNVPLSELSPVVVTQNLLNQQITGKMEENLMNQVISSAKKAGNGKDILLMEGGGSLREGYIVNLPTPEVAKTLNSKVLVVVRYRDEIRLLDDVLAAKFRLGDSMCGIIINRVNSDGSEFVDQHARPYIEQQGVKVFGVLPEARKVAALMVDEIIDSLDSQVLTDCSTNDILVENITVGASGAVFGILAAFTVLFPNVELMLIFFPVPIKAKYLVPGYAVLELLFGVANFKGDNIAHFAHLGGALFGLILVLIWKKNQFRRY